MLEAPKTTVHSLVSSKIDYRNVLLAGLLKQQADRLDVMNCATRIVTGTSKFEHITLALKALHWLPVEFSIFVKIACFTYLADLLHWYEPTRNLRSSSKDLLSKPPIHTKRYGSCSFNYITPTVYNSLPLEIHQASSIDSFKVRLKMYFFIRAFGPWSPLLDSL